MNTEEQIILKLAEAARAESPPRVDVANRVMAILYERQAQRVAESTAFAWVAGVGAAAAVPLVVAAMSVWQTMTDPMLGALLLTQ